MDVEITLIKKRYKQDELLQFAENEEVRRIVLARVQSVGRSEQYQAAKIGLTPELVFITPAINYDCEEVIEYNGQRYAIYRTYRQTSNDDIEMYVHRKGGV